jgi:Ribbon-helix-helix protein, copG family
MGTSHGAAKVRPDGKVRVSLTISATTYHELYAWARDEGISMGELVERLIEYHLEDE